MGRVEKLIEIRAPPEKVWEMLALDRWPEWMEGYKSSEYTSEVRTSKDKYRVGASAHITVTEKPKAETEADQHREEWDFEITESLENEKITYSVRGVRGAEA